MSIYSVKECDFCHRKDVDGARVYKCDMCESMSCDNHKIKVLSDGDCICESCSPKTENKTDIKFRYTYVVTNLNDEKIAIEEYWTLKDLEDLNIANLYGNKITTNVGTFYVEQKVTKKEIYISELNKWFTVWEK